MTSCVHLDALPDLPGADEPATSCPACEQMGRTDWVHLRRCLSCGQVGCCDSSSSRHATGHFQATGHPVMRSAQPGEDWRWCYVDEQLV